MKVLLELRGYQSPHVFLLITSARVSSACEKTQENLRRENCYQILGNGGGRKKLNGCIVETTTSLPSAQSKSFLQPSSQSAKSLDEA
jgi:hypothetical protein